MLHKERPTMFGAHPFIFMICSIGMLVLDW